MTDVRMFKIEISIPEEYTEELREALNAAGACRVGNYDNCMSIRKTRGYWRPLEGAAPFSGTIGKISEGEEVQVEVRCAREHVREALAAARRVHPYEEPVISVIPLFNEFFE